MYIKHAHNIRKEHFLWVLFAVRDSFDESSDESTEYRSVEETMSL